MSTEYHKIDTLFKRDRATNRIVEGDYTRPEFEYLSSNEWVFTEKVDGCLARGTRISMADGSVKPIQDVVIGDMVLGVSDQGATVASAVTAALDNGPAERWMKIKGSRLGAGRGSSFFAVTCTPNHRFWMPSRSEYVRADKLTAGDDVLLLRSELMLTPCQQSVLLGKMLGDGTLARRPNNRTSAMEWGHRVADEEYVSWTMRALGDMAHDVTRRVTSGYGSEMARGRTIFHPSIAEHFADFIQHGRKTVPEWVADALDPLALAFWYMDDGSLSVNEGQEDRVTLSTCGFDAADCAVLRRGLAKLGIGSVVMQDVRGYLTIRVNSDDAERLFLLVAPYIPPVMQRKLPERYRGHSGWLPSAGVRGYKPQLVPQVVQEIVEDFDGLKSRKLDIETETHNFFANGVLVHNSNIRLSYDGSPSFAGNEHAYIAGRTDSAQIPPHLLNRLMELMRSMPLAEVFGAEPCDITLYGEGYGAKIQKGGGNYLRDRCDFVLFDVSIGGWWLRRDDVHDVAAKLGIDAVPVLDTGTLADAVEMAREGFASERWPGVLDAEGLVLRPATELRGRNGDRIITKVKARDFR